MVLSVPEANVAVSGSAVDVASLASDVTGNVSSSIVWISEEGAVLVATETADVDASFGSATVTGSDVEPTATFSADDVCSCDCADDVKSFENKVAVCDTPDPGF